MIVLEFEFPFIQAFIFCHSVLLIISLLVSLLKKTSVKTESKNWIYTLNTWLPPFAVISFILSFKDLLIEWYQQTPYEWYQIQELHWKVVFYMQHFIAPLIGVLFFFQKLRLNALLILLYLIAQNIYIIEAVIIKWTKDFQPSGWSTEENSPGDTIIQCLLPLVLSGTVYFVLHKRKKLPYPSLFLK
ncbi:hypothetical protein [Ferruginibacter sp.]